MAHHFTIAEVNAMIPELTPLLQELRSQGRQLAAVHQRTTQVNQKLRGNGHHNPTEDAMVAQITESLQEGLQEGITRLNDMGIELKDLDEGLVDFPAMREGRTVFLCWKLGEPEVAYWHELNTGFASRQPVDDQFA
ncbi:MAG: DUF2203 domain-containing protein [Chloroflexia bacterium]